MLQVQDNDFHIKYEDIILEYLRERQKMGEWELECANVKYGQKQVVTFAWKNSKKEASEQIRQKDKHVKDKGFLKHYAYLELKKINKLNEIKKIN